MDISISGLEGPVFAESVKVPNLFKIAEPIIEIVKPAVKVVAVPLVRMASSVAKTVICALGTLFQGAKTLVKLPFAAVLLPFAYILGRVAKYCKNEAMKDFANGMGLDFSKDLIMTIHLVHFTLSDKDKYSLGGVLRSNFEVVAGTEEYYRSSSARELWSNYIYGNKSPEIEAPESTILVGPVLYQGPKHIIRGKWGASPEKCTAPYPITPQ